MTYAPRKRAWNMPSALLMACGLIAAISFWPPVVQICSADTGPDQESNEDTAKLLAEVAQAYQQTETFYEKIRILAPVALQAAAKAKHMRLKLWFQKPNRLKIESPQYQIVSDGTELMVYIKKLNQYVISKAPDRFDQSWYQKRPFFRLPLPYTPLLLTDGKNTVAQISRDARRNPELDRKIKKAPCLAIELPRLKAFPQLDQARIFIDQQTHLIRRVTIKDPTSKEDKWITWIDVLKVEPDTSVDESSFAISPPKRAKRVESFQW